MRKTQIFGFIFVSLFLVSFASAYSTYTIQHEYYNDDTHVKTVYYTFDKNYQENEHRYPVSDYKEGYTYRTSKEYLEKKYGDREISDRKYSSRKSSQNKNRESGKLNYPDYTSHRRTYEEKNCYDSPPKGKLFYIKCDF
jgi:hypothetical protein